MMNARILTMSLAVATLTLAGCNNNENEPEEFQNGELRLTSGVNTLTRSFGIDQQINSGQKVAVYVDKATPSATPLYGNNVLTADGSGALTGGTPMYFPSDKSNVDIYAFATNAALTETFPASALTHSVNGDQTQIANYAASDLLYAASKAVTFTKNAVPLKFYHLLSKVEVALKSGDGAPVLTNATVTIESTKPKADFTPNKAKAIDTESNRTDMIALPQTDNDVAPITIGTKITTNDFGTGTEYAEAVIVPQKVIQDAVFIKVQLANSGTTYSYKLDAETTFAGGKKYQYKITVNNTGLTVTSSIENWTPVADKTGSAEMD